MPRTGDVEIRPDPGKGAADASAASDREVRADRVSRAFLETIPRDFARRHHIVSQGRHGEIEHLAVAAASSPAAVFNVGTHLGVEVRPHVADTEVIVRLIDEVYGHAAESGAATGDATPPADDSEIDHLLAEADRDLLSTQGKGPVVRLVDALLFEALARQASDVHVQPLADQTLVRYRLDGVLHTARRIPRTLTGAVISRIKVMGRMDIAEKRAPQDGRASVTIGGGRDTGASGGRSIDMRISTLPTSYGERAVIRLLDTSRQLCDLAALGMPTDVADRYLDRATRANGIVLLTGPTGSGKTTTLYATLRHIGTDRGSASGGNIMTIEDPIEYELSTLGLAISQSQVNPKKGVTFATGLRHILRQDPDVVMVGEIRDAETARIAIQSSLTGHLVLSTLHTNDAGGAITRLIDLGVEPCLLSASLSAVMAQRLVRLVHAACVGRGCERCLGTGYQGRRGLFELLVIDEVVRGLISSGGSLARIRAAAQVGGMRTLTREGRRLVEQGLTTGAEIRRVVEGSP